MSRKKLVAPGPCSSMASSSSCRMLPQNVPHIGQDKVAAPSKCYIFKENVYYDRNLLHQTPLQTSHAGGINKCPHFANSPNSFTTVNLTLFFLTLAKATKFQLSLTTVIALASLQVDLLFSSDLKVPSRPSTTEFWLVMPTYQPPPCQ